MLFIFKYKFQFNLSVDKTSSPSTSNFNDQLKIKEMSDAIALHSKKGHFLNKEMKKELIQTLATKEARRLLNKTSLKEVSKFIEKNQS